MSRVPRSRARHFYLWMSMGELAGSRSPTPQPAESPITWRGDPKGAGRCLLSPTNPATPQSHRRPVPSGQAGQWIASMRSRRVQRETLGYRGCREDPLYGIGRMPTRGYERLSDRQRARLDEGLRSAIPSTMSVPPWPAKRRSGPCTPTGHQPAPAGNSSASTSSPR
jgi:hypothetical protein